MATVSDLKEQVDEVLLLLRRVVGKRQIRDPLGELHPDLTGPQVHVLASLGLSEAPLPMHELSQMTGASSPSMTGVIDRLETRGLVSRERDDADRRLVLINLTADGKIAFEALHSGVREKISGVLGCLSADERCSFVHLIGRIADVLSSSPSDSPPISVPTAEKPTP